MFKSDIPDFFEDFGKKRCKQQRQWIHSKKEKGVFPISIGALCMLLIVAHGEALPSRVLGLLEGLSGDYMKSSSHANFEIFIAICFIVNCVFLLSTDDRGAS